MSDKREALNPEKMLRKRKDKLVDEVRKLARLKLLVAEQEKVIASVLDDIEYFREHV